MSNCSKYPNKAGIYKFTCINNGKIYIGKSVNIYNRMASHKCMSKNSNGRCYFDNALIKHGWDFFTVEILEIFENFDKTKLEDRLRILAEETSYMDMFDSKNRDKGYNICGHSNDRTGVPHSEEAKAKMRKPRSEESKEKMRKPKSVEHREALSKSHMGQQNSLGHKHSDETKLKMSLSKKGKPLSEEHKEKIGKSRLGIPRSKETIEKMRQANLGNKNCLGHRHSEESKEKMRQAKRKKQLVVDIG